jgi:hypothetical protein
MTTKQEISDALLRLAANEGNAEAVDAVCQYASALSEAGIERLIAALQTCIFQKP